MSLRRPKRNKWEHRALIKLRLQQAAKALQTKPNPKNATMTSKPKLYYKWHVHLISGNDDRRFGTYDCYWQAKNFAAELLNEYQLPLNARTEIRSTQLF